MTKTIMKTDCFEELSLCEPLLRALEDEGYERPTPIQQEAIPEVLAGKDLMATAQTGTGKTAAFSLPTLQMLSQRRNKRADGPRILILTPTRELALQIEDSYRRYGRHLPFRTAVVLGGVPARTQIKRIRSKPDVLVATPGRLLDLFRQGHVRLDHVEVLVLDEADRMLDMGFIHDVRRIVNETPRERQTLFFSATLSSAIADLASDMLRNPFHVEVTPTASVSVRIEQKVLFVSPDDKLALLAHVLKEHDLHKTLVFTRTKHMAERIARYLVKEGIVADSIHSNKNQSAREKALAGFDKGEIDVLVATDIVARGIDVDGISHVVNFEMPNDAESYVHRIGRTARADASGIAFSFCDAQDLSMLRAIEKLTRAPLAALEDHPYHVPRIAELRNRRTATRRSLGRRRTGSRGRSRPL